MTPADLAALTEGELVDMLDGHRGRRALYGQAVREGRVAAEELARVRAEIESDNDMAAAAWGELARRAAARRASTGMA